MNVKLTLRLDDKAIEKGRRYAVSQGTSLSQLVQSYFIMLDDPGHEALPVSPRLQALIGIGAGGFDESAYREHLERKHAQ
ncbi:MAG: DUF6364 family protein [Eggerthellaceae bacterium]|nr:DUF6364 family protein [Eggerthellaceae bacterium]